MLLNDSELEEITGYKLHGWQARWLKSHGWRFELSRNGRPVVSRAYAESRLSDAQATAKALTLNFDAIKKRA